MADVLDAQAMLAKTFQPKQKHLWILSIDGIDGFTCKTAQRPQVDFDEHPIDYLNDKRFIAGKATPQTMTVTLHDPIVPSAAQKIQEWIRLCYENQTGRAGYADFYKKTINLQLLDPVGAIVEDWEIQGAWVQSHAGGDLDYASTEPVENSITIRYDKAVLLF